MEETKPNSETIITKELIKKIHDRANEVYNIKNGNYPDRIELDGESVIAVYEYSRYGDWETETQDIPISDLTDDLDVIIEKVRIEREEREEREKAERERNKIIYEAAEKEKRRKQYLELKKEFK